MASVAQIAKPIIGLGTSIVGGLIGSSAAKKAAKAQADAAYTAGSKILQTATDVNKGISDAEVRGNGQVNDATNQGRDAVISSGQRASSGVLDATQRGVDRLTPYSDVGTQAFRQLGDMTAPGGSLMRDFTAEDMRALDPGYQFRIDQASKALSRASAARGSTGGGALKALSDYTQNLASSEFNNAFNRFDTNRKFQFGALSDISKTGLQAGEAAGQLDLAGHQIAGNFDVGTNEFGANLGMQGAQFQANNSMRSALSQGDNFMTGAKLWGDDIMGAGNALASGYMGAANAWSSALNGIGEAASGFFGAPGSGGAPAGFTPYSAASKVYDPNAGYTGGSFMPTYGAIPSTLTVPEVPTLSTLPALSAPAY
jgi:hypothetical protein